jgi:uncharacterized protein (DUF4415 family)
MSNKITIIEGECDYLEEDAAPEYDLATMKPAEELQARFRAQATRRAVQVDADVLEFFKNPQAINEALRHLMEERRKVA